MRARWRSRSTPMPATYGAKPQITTFGDRWARCSVCGAEFDLEDAYGDNARIVLPQPELRKPEDLDEMAGCDRS